MPRNLDSYQDEYDNLPFERHQAAFRRQALLKYLAKAPGKKIVEVGCGMLPLFTDLQDFQHMTVIEPADRFYENATALAALHVHAELIDVWHGLLEDYQPPQATQYDLVILSSVLHEVPDVGAFLQAAIPLGTEQARFLVTTPNAESMHRQLAVESGLIDNVYELSQQQKLLQQRETYSTQTLTEELQRHGLVIDFIETILLKPFTHAQMQKLLDNKILSEEQLFALSNLASLAPNAGSEILAVASRKS